MSENKTLPNPQTCLALLHTHGCSDEVIQHCLAVRDIAVRIAQKAHANIALVEAGAILHDIGRSKTHGILHGVLGAELARNLGLPEQIIMIIELHIGAGIPKNESEALGLPPKDYMPISLEEKIVAHADNLISGNRRQNVEKEIEKALRLGLINYAERLKKLHGELSEICGVDLNSI